MVLKPIKESALSRVPSSDDTTLKTLEQQDSLSYISRLYSRLEDLSLIFKNEEDNFIIPYVELLKNSFKGLYLKYQLPEEKKIDFDLIINPFNSGYPTLKDFIALNENKKKAKENLDSIPKKEDILEIIKSGVMHGIAIDEAQDMLRRYNFYNFIDRNELFDYNASPFTSYIKKEGSRRFYTLSWGNLDWLWKVPVYYHMCFQQDSRNDPFELNKVNVLKGLILQTKNSHVDLNILAQQIDSNVEEIHPKVIERFTLGPYFDGLTKNPEEIHALFNGDAEPSLQKFIRERATSEREKPYGGLWEKMWGKKTVREVFSVTYSETRMVVPFRIKQKLGNYDEKGNPCKIYGIKNDGGIVG